MRLPDVQLGCEEHELRWRESLSNRHLVELPATFAPKSKQDVLARPAAHPVPQQRNGRQVGTPQPTTAQPTASAGEPAQAPMPGTGGEPARRPGVFRRFLRWWRGN